MGETPMMNPNRLTPPGTTVLSLLPEDPYSIVKLSAETGLTTAYLTRFLAGDARLTDDAAEALERRLGVFVSIWQQREARYRASLLTWFGAFALECAGRGIDVPEIAHRTRLSVSYIEALVASAHTDGALLYSGVVKVLEKAVLEPEDVWHRRREEAMAFSKGLQFRALYRDHWTAEDKAREADHQRAVAACHERRETALLVRGWRLFNQRNYSTGHCAMHRYANDPQTGEDVLIDDAFRTQEGREPGSVEKYPVRDFELPRGGFPTFNIGEVKVQPMQAPVGSVFYLDNERVKAAEDERLFKALDDVAKPSSDD